MRVNYRLLPKAESDYFSIYAYTYENFGEQQAEKYTRGLLDSFTLITEHPHIGRSINDIRTGYFRHAYEGHVIYYKLKQNEVLIIRVLANRQDHQKYI
ncbi:MAG: plasmid stabilization protein ParE [Alphaproteobacteria bacterium]|nr:MAG: plasmid stabilization protein ParE [Alphaproteobacteria bacterium]